MCGWRGLIVAVSLAIGIGSSSEAMAWGRQGHRLISRVAEGQLNAKTKAAIAALLVPGESLADASTWADEHRRELPKTAPWHYVDVPLSEPRYNSLFSGEVPEKGYVVDKIHDMKVVLRDPKRTVEDRRFALRFLIHMIEDLHMPMHVGDNRDRGGNDTQVRFFEQGTNMHRLWDSDLIERDSRCEECCLEDLAKLDSPAARAKAVQGTVEDWATESILAAREAYVDPTTGKRIKSGAKLEAAYFGKNLPVARQRMYLGGVRLAWVLNDVLAGAN
jgi:nuclease S1